MQDDIKIISMKIIYVYNTFFLLGDHHDKAVVTSVIFDNLT